MPQVHGTTLAYDCESNRLALGYFFVIVDGLPFFAQDSMIWHCTSQEISGSASQKLRAQPSKSEHASHAGCVLLGVLKAVEQELSKRELLGSYSTHVTPLWFLAETERNVFLWRSGKSIRDYHLFSFWIDLRALIHKRREQLSRSAGFNPFVQVSTSFGETDAELRYLDLIEELTDTIFRHAETLSHASECIRTELAPTAPIRTRILLPHPRDQGGVHRTSG